MTIPVPAPAPQPAPPPPPPAPSLAGAWRSQSTCPLDLGTDLTITPSGPEQYSITGISGVFSSAGWISGKHVHMEAWALLNHVIADGEVNTPTMMSGKVVSSLGPNCDWIAHKN
jgi:hypothetical protein